MLPTDTIKENFRDRVPTVTAKGKRNWIYAARPSGKFYRYRSVLSILYIILFFSVPFIRIHGNPALQLNIPEGKFSILGMLFWPQDFFIFGTAMVTFIVFIVLFTQVYGRLFCGWACPQTIFMEMLFRKIEWWIEGSRNQQLLRRRQGASLEKTARKAAKHLAFLALAFLIANTFLSYIIGAEALQRIISEPVSSHTGGFAALLVFTLVFYFVYAYMRELVCTVVCPYGRLQGVLLDKNTIVVAYDYNRGEPRQKGKRPDERYGDCVDCNQCVTVCPTGIDIRNGTQLECINCTACIDACSTVMKKTAQPKGLIRYASENGIANKAPFRFTVRIKVYSGILLLLTGLLGFMLASRENVGVAISRVGGQLYQEAGPDSLSNLYTITLNNKTREALQLEMRVANIPGTVFLPGNQPLIAPVGKQVKSTFFVRLPFTAIHGRETHLQLDIYHQDKKMQTVNISFLGYVQQKQKL